MRVTAFRLRTAAWCICYQQWIAFLCICFFINNSFLALKYADNYIPYDGSPYLCVGSKWLMCSMGPIRVNSTKLNLKHYNDVKARVSNIRGHSREVFKGGYHDLNTGFVRGITKSYKVLYLFLKNRTSYKVLYFLTGIIFL